MQKVRSEKLPGGLGNGCCHANTHRTKIPKICIRDFECWHCAFYQWLEEVEHMGPFERFPTKLLPQTVSAQ